MAERKQVTSNYQGMKMTMSQKSSFINRNDAKTPLLFPHPLLPSFAVKKTFKIPPTGYLLLVTGYIKKSEKNLVV